MMKILSAAVACAVFASFAGAAPIASTICLKPTRGFSHVVNQRTIAVQGKFSCKEFLSTVIVARPALPIWT